MRCISNRESAVVSLRTRGRFIGMSASLLLVVSCLIAPCFAYGKPKVTLSPDDYPYSLHIEDLNAVPGRACWMVLRLVNDHRVSWTVKGKVKNCEHFTKGRDVKAMTRFHRDVESMTVLDGTGPDNYAEYVYEVVKEDQSPPELMVPTAEDVRTCQNKLTELKNLMIRSMPALDESNRASTENSLRHLMTSILQLDPGPSEYDAYLQYCSANNLIAVGVQIQNLKSALDAPH